MTSSNVSNSIFLCVLFAAMAAFTLAAWADPFDQGSRRFSIAAGSTQNSDSNYTIIGLGAGYYLLYGLEFGLDAEAWLGGEPDVYKLSPQLKYVLPLSSQIRPYGGVFYRHIFIDGADDRNSGGVRGGVYFASAQNWFIGAGAVYEAYFDCQETSDSSCDEVYLETTFSLSF